MVATRLVLNTHVSDTKVEIIKDMKYLYSIR